MTILRPIGIDFGTTKTTVAISEGLNGSPVIYDNFSTIIEFSNKCSPTWQNALIGNNVEHDSECWKNFKLYMGEEKTPIKFCHDARIEKGEVVPSPVHLASLILKRVYKSIKRPEDGEDIGPVTITVPSESNFRHRQAVIFAAHVAGFKDVQILEEPIAAYLYYYYNNSKKFENKKKNKTFVIDFGGGTCDLAIIENKIKQPPIVLMSRTIQIGGNDIDNKILDWWLEDKDYREKLPEKGEYPNSLTWELTNVARKAKHHCNQMLSNGPNEIINMLKNPLNTLYYTDPLNYLIHLADQPEITPPALSPDGMKRIMTDILLEIDKEINYLLPNEEDVISIDTIIFAGGSSYVRPVVNLIIKKFNHLNIATDIFFDEPENAIAKGALIYQRQRMENKYKTIKTRLSMSTYIQVDYDHTKDISSKQLKASGTNFIGGHNKKSYVLLASRGLLLNHEKPILNPFFGGYYINIPIKKGAEKIEWKIFQVRSKSRTGNDIEEIEDTKPIDTIILEPNQFAKAWPITAPVILFYDFDIYGDFYRSARIFISTDYQKTAQHDKYPDLDWRIKELITSERNFLFGEGDNL